ncbi:hypothetical protein C8Q80DRAFT_780651 [Daedaleopsis nitida]|nr:hypothetical protein C8Q80DRAFT_780651 [Daedaleopsis nitida]
MQFTTLVALAVSFAVAAQAATVATPSDPAAAPARPSGPAQHPHPHPRVNVRFFKDAQCQGQAKTVELNQRDVNQCNSAGTSFRSLIVDVPKGSRFDVNDLQVGRDNCAQNTLRRIQKANACVDLGGKTPNTEFTITRKRGDGTHPEADDDDE